MCGASGVGLRFAFVFAVLSWVVCSSTTQLYLCWLLILYAMAIGLLCLLCYIG
jgi:hypothetical protein